MRAGAADFSRDDHSIVRGLVNERTRAFLYDYAMRMRQAGSLKTGDSVPTALHGAADPFMESLLEVLQPRIESETGLSLSPTYSYFRVYGRGDALARHKDRPSCEVSISLALGGVPPTPWPLWIEHRGIATRIDLGQGDGLVYKGIEVPHWREPFEGESLAQVFLHYVDRNGAHRDLAFDGRPRLGATPAARRVLGLLGSGA